MTLLLVVAVSAGFAVGVWLVVTALWPAPTRLASAIERLNTPGMPRLQVPSTPPDRSLVVKLGTWVLRRLRGAGFTDQGLTRDLAVVRRPLEVHVGLSVAAALAGALVGPLLWLLVTALGGTTLPVLVPVWLLLLGAVCGAVLPRLVLGAQASRARWDFRHALGAYLDVLVLLLAAQEGPESAMEIAARAGNGPAFMDLRRATNMARLSGEPVWDVLDELGRRIGVDELCEVAAAGSLAGERGAAVRRTLIAKARALRSATLSAAEAAARTRTQAMFAPVVLMGCGFILFLLYPLINNIQVGP